MKLQKISKGEWRSQLLIGLIGLLFALPSIIIIWRKDIIVAISLFIIFFILYTTMGCILLLKDKIDKIIDYLNKEDK